MWPVIIALLLFAIGLQRLFIAYSLKNVSYRAYASHHLVEPDQVFTICSEITNAKALPEFYIELQEPIPWEAQIDGGHKISGDKRYMTKRFYIMPRQRVKYQADYRLPSRGHYSLASARMYGGDFLGVRSNSKTFPYVKQIIVMPRRLDAPKITQALGGFLGDVSVRRFIMPDPVLTVGTRDYTGREPLRDIHHAHTARQNRLMVRQYDYTLEPAITVLLNTSISHNPPRYYKIEACLSLARNVFEDLNKAGAKFAFMTNAKSSYTKRWNSVSDGLGQGHINELLGGLGCAAYTTTGESFAEMLERAILKCEQGRCHIIITPEEDETIRPQLDRLRESSGGKLLFITADETAGLNENGLSEVMGNA